jgi:hypothetical protein
LCLGKALPECWTAISPVRIVDGKRTHRALLSADLTNGRHTADDLINRLAVLNVTDP